MSFLKNSRNMIKLPASQHDVTKEKAEVIELEAREERKRFLQLSESTETDKQNNKFRVF